MGDRSLNWVPPAQMQGKVKAVEVLEAQSHTSSVHGILQARIQDSLPFSPPGDLPNPGIKPVSPRYPALTGGFFAVEPLRKPIETNGKYQFLAGTIENHYNSQCFLLCAIYSRSHEILVTKAL